MEARWTCAGLQSGGGGGGGGGGGRRENWLLATVDAIRCHSIADKNVYRKRRMLCGGALAAAAAAERHDASSSSSPHTDWGRGGGVRRDNETKEGFKIVR